MKMNGKNKNRNTIKMAINILIIIVEICLCLYSIHLSDIVFDSAFNYNIARGARLPYLILAAILEVMRRVINGKFDKY